MASVLCTSLLLNACADVTNSPLCPNGQFDGTHSCSFEPDPKKTYRFAPKPTRDTLTIVTLSGGGTRAAALSFGTLTTLGTLKGPSGRTLLEDIDVISSVSGGSVIGGWYALKGPDGLAETGEGARLWNFLMHDWTAKLAWRALNPVTLLRYSFSPYTRSDVLADFFAAELFGNMTYADVLERYKTHDNQPYVIVNATDIGHESIFPFTQGRFDLLCSDLLRYPVADAVAASANFPLAFSPLGLENFSGCAAQSGEPWNSYGPPQWINHYSEIRGEQQDATYSYGLSQLRAARQAQDYLGSPAQGNTDRYIHLLDGGVTDNLGVRSTLDIEDDPSRVPGLYLRLGPSQRPDGYQNIRRVLYIVVNARTRNPGALDSTRMPPGELRTALRLTDTQLDSSTLADQDYLISELEATANRDAKPNSDTTSPDDGDCNRASAFLTCNAPAAALFPAPKEHLKFYVVSVDFELIPNKACRDRAWLLKTNWGLNPDVVRGLAELAKVILRHSADLADYYRDAGLQLPPGFGTADSKGYEEACRLLGST